MDVPIPILEREIARAIEASAAARARLARGEGLDAPSPLDRHRRASTRATYLDLAGDRDPIAAALRPWVAALTLDRVLWPDHARLAAAWWARSIPVEASGITAFIGSPRDLLRRVIAEPEPGRRRVWADALARGAGAVADAARILAERRVEAARLLGEGADAGEVPVDPPAAITAAAERVIADTAPFVDLGREAWGDVIGGAVARGAGEGWPARLTTRWLFDLFHGPLVEGLRLDLPRLPEPFGAASFARALGAFGAALAAEDGPRSAPFAIARSPFDLRRARRAALFASLAADPVFHRRALGLGRGRAIDQARDVARALAISIRLDAARVLLRDVFREPERRRRARFEEVTAAALGAPIPPALAGVVPRLGPEDPARLAGALLAIADRRALVERFDEDWFASPHAARALREEDAVAPASLVAKADAVSAGAAELSRALADLG